MEKVWLKSYDLGVPEDIDPDQFKNINEMLDINFKKFAKDPMLVSLGETLSYEEVDSISNQFAAYLQNELGLKKGMRLAVLMPSILQNVIVMLGALRLGLIVVNLPFTLPPDDIHKLIKLTEPECLVVFENFSPKLENSLNGISVKHVIFSEFGDLFKPLKRKLIHYYMRFKKKVKPCQIPNAIPFRKILQTKYASSFQSADVQSSDTAFLLFTNARDQALPKCVELTHRNIVANTMQAIAVLKLFWDGNFVKTSLCLFLLQCQKASKAF
jgi:long-chain acyl-CoA synthetase